jgi:multicomponent Na+:H+ antiporter subunit E
MSASDIEQAAVTAAPGMRRARLRRRVVLGVWFVVLWVALWGQITVANVASGIVVAVGLLVAVGLPRQPDARMGGGAFRPLRALVFFVYFAIAVVVSNLQLALQVIDPRNTVRPGILRLPLHGCSDALVTMIANAITLTPGSITVEVRRFAQTGSSPPGAVVYVHVLRADDPDQARSQLFRLARLAMLAFGSRAALRSLEATRAAIAAGETGLDVPASEETP